MNIDATKYTLKVEISTLSTACFPAILEEIARIILKGNTGGSLVKDDGDSAEWSTDSYDVSF